MAVTLLRSGGHCRAHKQDHQTSIHITTSQLIRTKRPTVAPVNRIGALDLHTIVAGAESGSKNRVALRSVHTASRRGHHVRVAPGSGKGETALRPTAHRDFYTPRR